MAFCNAPGRAESKSGAGVHATLALTSIQRRPELRSRVGPLDHDHVAGLAGALRDGAKPPRPVVYFVAGRGHFAVGGFHTLAAYEAAGVAEVPVVVRSGTWDEAVVAAACQNREHDTAGLRRTNADKRHAAMMVLAAHPEWSDRRIAGLIGVHQDLPGDCRRRLAEVSDSDTCRFREGADGKKYPLPLPDRSRPSSRAEHVEPLQPSWDAHGASVLPLLKNGIPLPKVLAAHQLNLKQLSCVIGRWLDLFDGPVYCPVARRLLSPAEKAAWLEWLLTNSFPELYGDEQLGESLEVLRDPRFPAGALP